MNDTVSKDIHVLKYFSSFVSISCGRVINVTEPTLDFCPLASHLYKEFKGVHSNNREKLKSAIKRVVESKIEKFGFFTKDRKFSFLKASIPYGVSEMVSFALRKRAIDTAVLVCEGAGTVIVDNPDMAQGIGARMNSLLLTSPISGIIEALIKSECRVVFRNALIDQERGVREAIRLGYKVVAVTICGHSLGILSRLRLLEKETGAKIISLVFCTTGITEDKIGIIRDAADLVWACASQEVRKIIGPLARCQLSIQIPVFVLTQKGMDFISAYADKTEFIRSLSAKNQYLLSSNPVGRCIRFGGRKVYVGVSKLPVGGDSKHHFVSYSA